MSIFEMARLSKVRVDNPAKEHKIPRRKTRIGEGDVFTMKQVIELVENTPDWARSLTWVLVFAGLRPSELCGLRVRHLDFPRRRLNAGTETLLDIPKYDGIDGHVAEGDGKTIAADRGIPLPQWLVDDIAAELAMRPKKLDRPVALEDRLFLDWRDTPTGRGSELRVRVLRVCIVRPALLRAGLPVSFRTYDLRHTHASLLFDLGHNPLTVGQRQGHTDPSITLRIYGHVYDKAQEKLTDDLDHLRAATLAEMRHPDVIQLKARRGEASDGDR